jgi:pilus assembly protein Flp/PilA
MSKKSRLCSIMALMCARFIADEQGATAIEYAMVAAGIGGAIAATVFSFGSELKTTFYDKIAALL